MQKSLSNETAVQSVERTLIVDIIDKECCSVLLELMKIEAVFVACFHEDREGHIIDLYSSRCGTFQGAHMRMTMEGCGYLSSA